MPCYSIATSHFSRARRVRPGVIRPFPDQKKLGDELYIANIKQTVEIGEQMSWSAPHSPTATHTIVILL